jgi:N-acetylmuramoyl-L-alanine amidase
MGLIMATASVVGLPADATSGPAAAKAKPLSGVRVAIDPGHQLGNSRFPRQINRLVDAGGFKKACNTTGTATNTGVPEATVVWKLSKVVKKKLEALGADVVMTRNANSRNLWGPCVDTRGLFAGKKGADLMVSIHADGSSSRNYGFHVISPKKRSPWTTATAKPSLRLSTALRDALTSAGIPRSTYIGSGTAISVRSDLGTLNRSRVPVSMIEIGNMRNARDAKRMTTASGRTQYANAIVSGIRNYLRNR